ncbi:hypothetical protein ASPVEDRAFT_41382 [Aspergillus versicolor CBS 583.65]|uniref:AB hydrolase-1 domain-containing protein n=1 Tax=Aspergillus versicolor CBS 583.65 TaxID=1036611 RepID=A0A1L9PK36_ASPVE|nr:uncharacterized protein ASPVEDRAFT_41382 [Aspergillus versicolor CBS 583.65]OJJ01805.1 hypothetical protein ASPVEDRAFT_41382 [Aspergillus versicolor CBS 583.65]
MASGIILDQHFTHHSSTHSTTIPWTTLGELTNPPLIFIHGTPWSSVLWHPYAKALASKYSVYLFDNPGFGESPGRSPLQTSNTNNTNEIASLDASLAGQAESFGALYHSWGFKEGNLPHVVAHDVGGLISLRGFLLHGCKYASLCLIDVVALRPFGSPFFTLVGQNPGVFTSIPEVVFEGMLREYIRGAAFKDIPADIEKRLERPWLLSKGGRQGSVGFIRQIAQADARDVEEVEGRYQEVGSAIPVKVIWGVEDRWIPVERAEELAKRIGARENILIEDAGHLVMLDQPERVAVEIMSWLMGVTRRG